MSEKITFKELVEQIARQSKQSQSSTNNFIHELVQIIESGLEKTGSVSISGFGKFELRWMDPRQSQHPQTGEQITVPGQNKVVFKPFKHLREEVNHPFAGLTSRVMKKAAEEYDASPKQGDTPANSQKTAAYASVASTSDSIDDLLIEHENPKFKKPLSAPEPEAAKPEGNAPLAAPNSGEIQENSPSPTPLLSLQEEEKLANEVQKAGAFKWSYAAAAIVAIIVFIILYFMFQRYQGTSDSPFQAAFNNQAQPEQTESLPSSPADEATGDNLAGQPETPPPDVTQATPDTNAAGATQTEFETEDFTVEPGQSLWTIAETQLGNPYLWPVIYHLNRDHLANPNSLPADSEIILPSISDPENLNEFEREQVALGYFDLYEWNINNNPDEARFFLWAVGVFSPDLLDQPPSDVNPQDLEFARNR